MAMAFERAVASLVPSASTAVRLASAARSAFRVSNADCNDTGKPACVLGKCRECGPDASCGAAQACFPRNSKCEARCSSDGDCPGDAPICIAEIGACVGCQTDADCASTPGTPICEPTRAQCSECESNADCGAAAPACDLNDGKCHECLIDANCPLSALCGQDRSDERLLQSTRLRRQR